MSPPTPSATDPTLGAQLARAIAAEDGTQLRALLSTPVTFRALTPSRFWDAEDPVAVSDIIRREVLRVPERAPTGLGRPSPGKMHRR